MALSVSLLPTAIPKPQQQFYTDQNWSGGTENFYPIFLSHLVF